MRHGVRGVSQTKQNAYSQAEAQDGLELIQFFYLISLHSSSRKNDTFASRTLEVVYQRNEQWLRKTTTPPIFSLSSADRTPLILEIKYPRQRKLILFTRKLAVERMNCFM